MLIMNHDRLSIDEIDIAAALGAVDEVELLGRGTFGSTFRVVLDDEEFALKVVHIPDMPGYLWEREIEALRRTDHPNVLSLYDSGTLDIAGHALPFLRCEYIDGGNLRQRILAQDRPVDAADLRGLLTGMLAGVAEIHDLGGLHRDIKPENVALRGGQWGNPVLLDFGLVRLADMSSHTHYPALVGTVSYMAPEQLRLKPARTRSDLFSVGVTVYEVGTGVHPYATTSTVTPSDLHDRILASTPSDPRALSSAFDGESAEVVLRLMRYRGHERLGVNDALRDLGRLDA